MEVIHVPDADQVVVTGPLLEQGVQVRLLGVWPKPAYRERCQEMIRNLAQNRPGTTLWIPAPRDWSRFFYRLWAGVRVLGVLFLERTMSLNDMLRDSGYCANSARFGGEACTTPQVGEEQ